VIVEIGHFALILALVVACVQTGSVVWGAWRRDEAVKAIASTAAVTQFVLLALAFGTLVYAYISSDFAIKNVWENSHTAKPVIYKISAVWGNHEGSMLLWVTILAAFGAAIALLGNNLPTRLKYDVLAVQGSIGIAFLLFTIVTSNPFIREDPVPMEGRGLSSVLQDPALAIHPPLLYVGYVGLSIAFSFAVAALIEGRITAAWGRWVRPWTLASWLFLTLGIATGSWWAYYELGWGGWWNWDPVENASFMPWLAATALLHSAIVMEKREALRAWTVLLAIVAFVLSLVGTFLVRSRVVQSVHAFASDPSRGVFLLGIVVVFSGVAFALFAKRAPMLRDGRLFAPISREASLLLNNLILSVACGAVLIGTLYPMVHNELFEHKLTVGAPYFNLVFSILMTPLLIAVPYGPYLPWKRGDLYAVSQRLLFAVVIAILSCVAVVTFIEGRLALAPFGIGLGIWVVVGALAEWVFRVKLFTASWPETWRRIVNLPRSNYGATLAHLGLGIATIGVVAAFSWRSETNLSVKPQQTVTFAGYELVFNRLKAEDGPNYREIYAEFALSKGGRSVTMLRPGKRRYEGQPDTTETAIHPSWTGDYYLASDRIVSDEVCQEASLQACQDTLDKATKENATIDVRVLFDPFVRFIWLGACIMALGGGLSLSDRRLRVGVPMRKAQISVTAANAGGQPA
jgi:cytochrome c-type biogenesis protein CcmF